MAVSDVFLELNSKQTLINTLQNDLKKEQEKNKQLQDKVLSTNTYLNTHFEEAKIINVEFEDITRQEEEIVGWF